MKYPFTPEVLDTLPEELAELYRNLENTLLEEICSRLKLAENLNEVTVQDIRALRSMGIDLEDIKEAIAETAKISDDKLNKLLDEVIHRNQSYYSELVDLAEITKPERFVDASDIDAIRRQTKAEFTNLTQSSGFLVRKGGKVVKLPPAKAYQWALDNAEMQIMSGGISYREAIKNAVKQLADSGIKTVDYESGHVDHVDVAARRAVMTGVNQVCQKYSEQSVDFLGTDLVEVSAHQGARDTGTGPENHKEWQGKVYRWKEKQGNSKENYPDFIESTGYGTGPGLGGWNCRHHFYPFYEGVSERTYTDNHLANIDPPPFEYQGKVYTAYEATQQQRKIERTIRKLKREKAAYEASGLNEEAQDILARIRRLNAEYNRFSEAAGLPVQKDRTRVLGQMEQKVHMHRRWVTEEGRTVIDKATYHKITKPAIKKGAFITIADEKWMARLKEKGATAVTIGDNIIFRPDATVTEVLEEVYHFEQNRRKLNYQYPAEVVRVLNEIDAQKYLISVASKYKIPLIEQEQTFRLLEEYQTELEKLRKEGIYGG